MLNDDLSILFSVFTGGCGKTRNLLGIAIVHCIYDFLTMVNDAVFTAGEANNAGSAAEYMISGEADGLAALATYIMLIAVAALAVVILYKKVVKTIDFDEIRKSW